MSKKHIIIAPHGDDEIIGCYEILIRHEVDLVVFPTNNQAAIKESVDSQKRFGFNVNLFSNLSDLQSWADLAKKNGGLLFLPDPIHEYHPEHRKWGGLGRHLRGDIVYYTTNMNAPYMHECKHAEGKRSALYQCYPEKSSLWEYDHKYFLFEGHTTWDISPLL